MHAKVVVPELERASESPRELAEHRERGLTSAATPDSVGLRWQLQPCISNKFPRCCCDCCWSGDHTLSSTALKIANH